MKRLFIIFFVVIDLLLIHKTSFCKEEVSFASEPCYIDNNYVLLYKIINWWNDALPGEDAGLCGSTIRCESNNHIRIEYKNQTISLLYSGYFDDLLSIFKECKECFGPSYFECTWLNNRYFDKMDASSVPLISKKIKIIQFNNMSKKHAELILNLQGNIKFEIEGKICGLLLKDGKVALHHSGAFLKRCPLSRQNKANDSSIRLSIVNLTTGEPIARYSAVFIN